MLIGENQRSRVQGARINTAFSHVELLKKLCFGIINIGTSPGKVVHVQLLLVSCGNIYRTCDIADYLSRGCDPWVSFNFGVSPLKFRFLFATDCVFAYTRPLITCLADEGIGLSIQSATNPNIPDALVIQKHRIGSIVLLDGLNLTSPDNILHVVRILARAIVPKHLRPTTITDIYPFPR